MSELITQQAANKDIRRHLLVGASAIVLIAATADVAQADDNDHPTVWIELGGQLERVPRAEDAYLPAFTQKMPRPDFETINPISFAHAPRYSVGGEGKLTFEPKGTDWVFSAGVRYGRSNGKTHSHKQTYTPLLLPTKLSSMHTINPGRFEDAKTKYDESHAIVDFSVGRDVGLGLFGKSVASLGVRYAELNMNSSVHLSAKPDWSAAAVNPTTMKYTADPVFHLYQSALDTERSFHGVGPSLSFNGATPLIGDHDGQLTFDWGVMGALLFGRQHTTAEHHTYGLYSQRGAGKVIYNITNGHSTNHSVTVPNVGGFAGVSMRYPNAKLSFGFRGDIFFGAMDGGLDARKSYDRTFYGPFATISIGLGG